MRLNFYNKALPGISFVLVILYAWLFKYFSVLIPLLCICLRIISEIKIHNILKSVCNRDYTYVLINWGKLHRRLLTKVQ